MPTKFFGTVTQNIFDGKTWYPLLLIKIFVTKIFLENRRVLLQNFLFRSCETKKFDRTVIPPPPPLVCMKMFDIKNFLKRKIVLQRNFLAQWDKNFSTENRDNSPLPSPKIFLLSKLCGTQNGSLVKLFGPVRKKNFRQNSEALPLLCLKTFDNRIHLKDRMFS